ncbi:glycosyltransferase family protein [Vibrio genomosp. F10 str. 9ZC157]|uniref:Lipopolysaccharide biosynthesis protein n=1 Tax=Vibrio genomosp. F10 str. ZF-129 TaxID=1187848 RepID=A0A1E5BD95_9VIBR|nr:hypothetical protein [Vibrio genomosp. F10]OEE33100.1 lipopolysaccharide biosynthesis protein [Vibrio genomosp. F10 str. ZF-129]OEE95601.1 lipopolysaccharide biosynthesis protein [Vibrio genomosp. F10 str. 9ZC157]
MKKIVFLGYKQDYEKLELEALGCDIDKSHVQLSKWQIRLISNLFFFNKKLYHRVYGVLIRQRISKLGDIESVFVTDSLRDIRAAASLECQKVLTFRNIFNGEFLSELEGFDVYTFDKNDAKKYAFKTFKVPLPSLNLLDKYRDTNDFDISFVGLDKGRKGLINEIDKSLPEQRCNFIVFDHKGKLSYEGYLQQLLNAKSVLEISIDGQSANTMRFIEALYCGKKVITNNKKLKKHEFYNSNNVLIFDDLADLKRNISAFLTTPFDNSILSYIELLRVDNVYRNILDDLQKIK